MNETVCFKEEDEEKGEVYLWSGENAGHHTTCRIISTTYTASVQSSLWPCYPVTSNWLSNVRHKKLIVTKTRNIISRSPWDRDTHKSCFSRHTHTHTIEIHPAMYISSCLPVMLAYKRACNQPTNNKCLQYHFLRKLRRNAFLPYASWWWWWVTVCENNDEGGVLTSPLSPALLLLNLPVIIQRIITLITCISLLEHIVIIMCVLFPAFHTYFP